MNEKMKAQEGRVQAKRALAEEEKMKRQEERALKKLEKQEELARKKLEKEEERMQKKLKKEEEAAKQKALKQLNSKNRLNVTPEESMKSMEVVIHEAFCNTDFFTDLLKAIKESDVKFSIQSQIISNSIMWKRKVEENYVNDKHEVCSNVQVIDENQIIIIWSCEETIEHICNNTLVMAISNVKSLVPKKKLSLVIYKIENYFKYIRSLKNQAFEDEILSGLGCEKQKKTKTKSDKNFSHLPKVSRKKFEECLVEIQIQYDVSSRLIDSEAEMVLLIHQYTKSLAQAPAKLKKEQDTCKFDWYADYDYRDTVKVDENGNGLKRLWQQQLCQFNLASLEIAEAISSVYKSPSHLMQAYENCSPSEGEILLKDIPIRRAAGTLTSVRKIGPELSRKMYITFTSVDGETYLND